LSLYIIILGPIPVVYIDTTGWVVSDLNNHMCRILAAVSIMFGYSNMNNYYRSYVSSKIVVCCTSFRQSRRFIMFFSKPFDRHSVTRHVSVNSEMTPFKFSSSYCSSSSLYIILLVRPRRLFQEYNIERWFC